LKGIIPSAFQLREPDSPGSASCQEPDLPESIDARIAVGFDPVPSGELEALKAAIADKVQNPAAAPVPRNKSPGRRLRLATASAEPQVGASVTTQASSLRASAAGKSIKTVSKTVQVPRTLQQPSRNNSTFIPRPKLKKVARPKNTLAGILTAAQI